MVWTTAHVEVFDADQTVEVKNNLYSACHVRSLSAVASQEFARMFGSL